MSAAGAMAGAFVGTLILTTMLRAASELRLTRVDLPFLLGTILTANRARAKALGYVAHFGFGFLFAAGHYVVFLALGQAGWLLGALFGLLHGAFAATALVNVLLPVVHPRMGGPLPSLESTALVEPPGFLMLNYGRGTPAVTLLAHVANGAVVGGFTGLAAS